MSEALDIAIRDYRKLGRKESVGISFIGAEYASSPSGEIKPVPPAPEPSPRQKILMLHHLLSLCERPETGELIDFKRLPGGITYNPVFEGRVYGRVTRVFGGDQRLFLLSGRKLGGEEATYGDVSMKFEVLPRVPVYVILYSGGDEFPPACKLLFDRSILEYFPTEDVIIICEELSKKLAEEAKKCRK